MAAQVPIGLRPVAHYIKIANENASRDPVIYYWSLLYAVQTGMALDKSAESKQYLSGILITLEKIKKQLAGNEAISQEVVAQARIEEYALQLFNYADAQDRSGNFTKNVVKAFYTSGHLFDVLSLFGELDEQLAANRKYAKWKATYIHNCLKNGEQPVPGPPSGMGEEGAAGGHDAFGDNHGETDEFAALNNFIGGGQPTQPGPSPRSNIATTTSISVPAKLSSGMAAPTVPAASADLSVTDWADAMKWTKYAMSAINYEDTSSAVDNLQKAIAVLTKKSF